ncbi:MAG: thioredoxin [Halobacteriota archaeon]
MTETDKLEEIRQRKREALAERVEGNGQSEKAHTAPAEPLHVTGPDHLDELVSKYDVVLVDFYADWCGPCKMLEPTVAALARETDAAVAKVDIDSQQALAAQYQVRGVPTLVLFADGNPVEQVVGVRDKSHFETLIQRHATV